MKFSATLRGVAYSDPQEFAAAVKAAPPLEPFTRGGKPAKVSLAPNPDDVGIKGFPIFRKPRVTLTADEKVWLGASVRLAGGLEGQVWALAPERGCVWVVAAGESFWAHVNSLTVVESRVDQLALEV